MQNAMQTRLREQVKAKGITQRHVAQETGIKEYRVSDLFCNRREMKADEFVAICIAIGTSPNKIAGIDDKKEEEDEKS